MFRRKTVIAVLALAIAVATLLTQETVAYYTVLGENTNVITTGEVSVRIVEKMGNNDFPSEGVYITPGKTVSKKLTVINNGENPCWLRIKLQNGIDDAALSADVYSLNINTTDWIKGADGYYYYGKILEPNTETEQLFSELKIAGSVDNKYLGKTLKLSVSAYAVQSEYNDSVSSPLEVAGWPAEG